MKITYKMPGTCKMRKYLKQLLSSQMQCCMLHLKHTCCCNLVCCSPCMPYSFISGGWFVPFCLCNPLFSVFSLSSFRLFAFVFSSFRFRLFVFSLSSFRLFAFVFSSFRLFAFVFSSFRFRLFVFSPSSFRFRLFVFSLSSFRLPVDMRKQHISAWHLKSRLFKLFILLFKFMSTQGRVFSQRLYSINLLVFYLQSVRLESAKVNSMINFLITHIKI